MRCCLSEGMGDPRRSYSTLQIPLDVSLWFVLGMKIHPMNNKGEIALGIIGIVFLAGWIVSRIQLSKIMKEPSVSVFDGGLVRR